MSQVIDNPVLISLFVLKTQLTACKLEVAGMKSSRGSVLKFAKDTYKLAGRTKKEIYDAFADYVAKQEKVAQNILAGEAQLN